jgi:hypothetical protein
METYHLSRQARGKCKNVIENNIQNHGCARLGVGIVLLYPRIMSHGHVPPNNVTQTYPNSYEIARGCWDGYGQLSPRYALQSAPHMRAVWAMVAWITGSSKTTLADEDCCQHCGGGC